MTPDDFQTELDKQNADKQKQQDKQDEISAITKAGIKNVEATNANTKSTAEGLKNVRGKVAVTNPDLAKSSDLQNVTDAIHKMNMTAFITNDGLPKLAENLSTLSDKVKSLSDNYENEGLTKLSDQLLKAVSTLEKVSQNQSSTKTKVDGALQKALDKLNKSITAIDFKPSVNVSAPDTKVVNTPVDFKPVLNALSKVEKAIEDNKPEKEETDLSPVTQGLSAVQDAIQALRFPVANYVLPFKDSNGKDTQVQLDGSGNIPVTGGSGGGSTQYTDGAVPPTHPVGNAIEWNDGSNWQTASTAKPLPVSASFSGSVTTSPTFAMTPGSTPTAAYGLIDASYRPVVVGAGTAGSSAGGVLSIQGVGSGTAVPVSGTFWQATQPISAASLPLPTGASTSAKQPALGTAGSASSDVLTVQGITSMTPIKTDGSGTTQPISGTVTANAGTNLNTSLLALESGGNLAAIKTDTDKIPSQGQALAAASMPVVLPSAQITTLTPPSNTGYALDSSLTTIDTDLKSNITLHAGTNLIGKVGIDQTTPGTTNAVSANQSTAANLNATVVGTGTFAVQTTSDTPGTGTTNLGKAEDAASASGDTGVFVLGVRNDTIADSTNTNGDYTQFSTDVKGHMMTANAPRLLKVQQTTTITASTAETTVLTAVASTFLDVYGVIIANSSATAEVVTFKDATSGTTRFTITVPAGDTRGFMLPIDAAYNQAAVNNNWTATCSTSLTSIFITLMAVKNI